MNRSRLIVSSTLDLVVNLEYPGGKSIPLEFDGRYEETFEKHSLYLLRNILRFYWEIFEVN